MRLFKGGIAAVASGLIIPCAVAQTLQAGGNITYAGGTESYSSNPGGLCVADGTFTSAFATPTALGASAEAVAGTDVAYSSATRTVSDWVVSGPSATTYAAISVDLKGTLLADMSGGEVYVAVGMGILDTTTGYDIFGDNVEFGMGGDGMGDNVSFVADGLGSAGGFTDLVDMAQSDPSAYTSALSGGLTFSTNPIAWNSADTYEVAVSVATYAAYSDPQYNTAPPDEALFSDPLSFASTPLELPSGWTLNSPQSDILDNHLTTPEPAPFAALGLGLLAAFRRRRGR